MTFLYLDPIIYVPYELSLRKKDAITLKEFYIEGGDSLPIVGFKPRRMPNKNFVYLEFKNPNYIDVSSITDTDQCVSFLVHYEINHNDKIVSVRHRQHIGVSNPDGISRFIKHFNIKHACPAMYGLEGKKIIDRGGLASGGSKHREIITFGLDGEDHEGQKWVFESFDLLYPSEKLKHGTLH